jgi:hypothetical protein
MAITIIRYSNEPTVGFVRLSVTADGEITPNIAFSNSFLTGGATGARSGASNYTVVIEASVDGANWYTLGTLTQASPNLSFTAALLSGARLIRVNTTTTNSQTITVTIRWTR